MVSRIISRQYLALLIFAILGFVIYSNTWDVPFYFDDLKNIKKNLNIRLNELSLGRLVEAGSGSPLRNRPVAYMSFALNYYYWQDSLAGYHIINLAIHVATGMLLFLLIKITLALWATDSGKARRLQVAFFATVLWLVHPIQTQSVTYVVQRMNSMASMLYVLSLLFYVKGRLVRKNPLGWAWFAGSLASWLLALGTKEIAATLPFFVLLYEWYFFQDMSAAWLRKRVPYCVATLVLIVCIVFFFLGKNPFHYIASGYGDRDFTMSQRVLTEFRVVLYYISLLVYPAPGRFSLEHDFALSSSLVEPISTLFAVTVIIGLVIFAIRLAREERIISFCILWFLGNLVIESSVVGLEIVFEHRLYLPSMLFFLPVVDIAYRQFKRNRMQTVVFSGLAVVLCVCTYERNGVWKDPIVFWADCAAKAPGKVRPHYNLGYVLAAGGRFGEAVRQYRLALELRPDDERIHNNLGIALANQGKLEEAIVQYKKAIEIWPGHAKAHNNLGHALARMGRFEDAIAQFSEALSIRPGYKLARQNLLWALRQARNRKRAGQNRVGQ